MSKQAACIILNLQPSRPISMDFVKLDSFLTIDASHPLSLCQHLILAHLREGLDGSCDSLAIDWSHGNRSTAEVRQCRARLGIPCAFHREGAGPGLSRCFHGRVRAAAISGTMTPIPCRGSRNIQACVRAWGTYAHRRSAISQPGLSLVCE